eukprot:9454167-Lingulodinium_polyedra.AAC.1
MDAQTAPCPSWEGIVGVSCAGYERPTRERSWRQELLYGVMLDFGLKILSTDLRQADFFTHRAWVDGTVRQIDWLCGSRTLRARTWVANERQALNSDHFPVASMVSA